MDNLDKRKPQVHHRLIHRSLQLYTDTCLHQRYPSTIDDFLFDLEPILSNEKGHEGVNDHLLVNIKHAVRLDSETQSAEMECVLHSRVVVLR